MRISARSLPGDGNERCLPLGRHSHTFRQSGFSRIYASDSTGNISSQLHYARAPDKLDKKLHEAFTQCLHFAFKEYRLVSLQIRCGLKPDTRMVHILLVALG